MLRILTFICLLVPCNLFANSILVLGDSLSSGHQMAREKSWPGLLVNKLSSFDDWQVVNASVSGETTAGGLARLPALVEKHRPNVCVLALGANDGLRGFSRKVIEKNLSSMIRQCEQYGRVILLGMRLPPNYGKAYTNAFENIYAKLAEQYELSFVPFFIDGVTEDPRYMQADNLHPNELAQPIILENVWPAIEATFEYFAE